MLSLFCTLQLLILFVQEELRAQHESQHGDAVMESIVNERSGSVLGKGSILKIYFFPGQRTSSRVQITGAPHVYKVLYVTLFTIVTSFTLTSLPNINC